MFPSTGRGGLNGKMDKMGNLTFNCWLSSNRRTVQRYAKTKHITVFIATFLFIEHSFTVLGVNLQLLLSPGSAMPEASASSGPYRQAQ